MAKGKMWFYKSPFRKSSPAQHAVEVQVSLQRVLFRAEKSFVACSGDRFISDLISYPEDHFGTFYISNQSNRIDFACARAARAAIAFASVMRWRCYPTASRAISNKYPRHQFVASPPLFPSSSRLAHSLLLMTSILLKRTGTQRNALIVTPQGFP